MVSENTWKYLTISNDFMFCKVMSDEDICRKTLKILLGKKIGEIRRLINQKVIDIMGMSKSIRLDVYVEDENSIYNVEMQVVNNGGLAKRSRYYQGIIDINSLKKGDKYRDLKKSFIIFICRFDLLGLGEAKYDFANCYLKRREYELGDEAYKIFYNTKAYTNEENKDLRALLKYIETNEISNSEFVKELSNEVRDINENAEFRRDYIYPRIL